MILILLLALLGATNSEPKFGGEIKARPPQVITIGEHYAEPFDARNGDTINIVMDLEGDLQTRCDHMGGQLRLNAYTQIWLCHDVDF